MNEIIENFCKINNLQYGIIDTKKLKIKSTLYKAPFSDYTLEERTNPLITMDNAKSIIVFIMPYKINTFSDKNRPLVSSPNLNYDYHKIFKKKLKDVASLLYDVKPFEYKVIVDSGMLMERELCVKAGLGYYSKNTNLINDKFGSCFFIGYIMSSEEFSNTNHNPSKKDCGKCTICMESCPTKVIKGNYDIDRYNCLSYITQKKEFLTDREKELFSNKVYGCNECVKVCPKNADFLYYEEETIEFSHFLENSSRTFKEKFENTGFFWRGNSVMKRNATIASINSTKTGDDLIGK